jgi:two-component system, cell cycle sensor histidine kinase and response regulator CckA
MSAIPELTWTPDPKTERSNVLSPAPLSIVPNTARNGDSDDTGVDHGGDWRVRHAQKLEAVGRLAGGIAHDFNNLLTGVLLYCDLLIANFETNQGEPDLPARKYVEEIRKAGLQATQLVRQLMAVARPTNGEPSLISLNEMVESMRGLLVRLIGENIDLKANLDPNLDRDLGLIKPGLIRMDLTQAQQVLLNLVLNARDALPAGGEIAIETVACRVQILVERPIASEPTVLPCALLAVSDNGSGMDAGTRAHLFEAFFTTKAADKGTGLGLATVHDIVTGNGGLIHVDSAVGRGTRITILLPLARLAPLGPGAAPNSQFECDLQSRPSEGALPEKEKE